ncbi:MAG: hypothetical protein GY915_05475, partial [bacterium]|nr:hypothetical protein [bacterium]
VGMWYKEWSSRGTWLRDKDGRPFQIKKSYPTHAPSLLRATYKGQHDFEEIASGTKQCQVRFSSAEREWWNNFLSTEESEGRGWEKISDVQLKEAGVLDWPLDSLKHYQNAKHDAPEETADVTRKLSQIQERFDKANTFKQVRPFITIMAVHSFIHFIAEALHSTPG